MTVLLETTKERFIGLSTDAKPTSVNVGSTFYEYDTRVSFITHDGTNWVTLPPVIKEIVVVKTLAQGTEPISVNLFSFTGPFRLRSLWGVCTRKVDSTDIDDAFFNLYDGANVIDLSDDAAGSGVTLTGIVVGGVFGVNAVETTDFFYKNADQANYLSATYAGSEIWQRGLVVAKAGVTNYVRFTYDSAADSGIDLDIEFHMVFADVSDVIPSALAIV